MGEEQTVDVEEREGPTNAEGQPLPYPPQNGRTHWEECWRTPKHHNCAVEKVYHQQEKIRAARRRAERLEERAREVIMWGFDHEHDFPSSDWQETVEHLIDLGERIDRLCAALDSREDEGEQSPPCLNCNHPAHLHDSYVGCTVGWEGLSQGCRCTFTPHEAEGDEAVHGHFCRSRDGTWRSYTSAVCSYCMGYQCGGVMTGISTISADELKHLKIVERSDPPTDEPVGGEGEMPNEIRGKPWRWRVCADCGYAYWALDYDHRVCNDCGSLRVTDYVPNATHADARSEPTPEKLREWAEWFDNPNEAPGFSIAPPRPSTPGMVLRQIADGLERHHSAEPPDEGEPEVFDEIREAMDELEERDRDLFVQGWRWGRYKGHIDAQPAWSRFKCGKLADDQPGEDGEGDLSDEAKLALTDPDEEDDGE